jgi:hypothetical protein
MISFRGSAVRLHRLEGSFVATPDKKASAKQTSGTSEISCRRIETF